ncbi:MAG: hypothetical protein HYX33_01080 [Actinobacteria bacterium]|nr:hypothetical protein [Actinomycetota bacterium]
MGAVVHGVWHRCAEGLARRYDAAIMMVRSQISLPAEDQRSAKARAADLGISLAEYIRRLVRADLGERPAPGDVSAVFGLGRSEGSDIARHKDEYVGDAIETRMLDGHRRPE